MTNKLTRPILRNISEVFNESLIKQINEMYDNKFDFTLGNCSFDEDKATFKLMVTLKGNSLKDIEKKKEKEDLVENAQYFDIDLERKHPRYTLIGYKVKSRKLPWIILDNQKKGEYVISDDQAKKLFGKLDVETFLDGQRKAQANG
jgi:hypothetical protein